jgi:hypothetical protein
MTLPVVLVEAAGAPDPSREVAKLLALLFSE